MTLNPLNRVKVPEKFEERVDQYEKIVRINLAKIYKQTKAGFDDNDHNDEDLADELGTDDIFTSNGVSEEAWETFIVFLEILGKILGNFYEDENIDLDGFRAGLYLMKAYRASILYANSKATSKSGKLYNLWNRLGVDVAIPASTPYIRKINDFQEDEFDKFWERYIVNEKYSRSIFSNTDKIKIMDNAIQNCVLINNLKYEGYLKAYFPLHNEYELEGWVRVKYQPIDDIEEDLKKVMGEDVYDTIEPEEKFVKQEWRVTPWTIFSPPVGIIRKYFGEKIAYYFDFLATYNYFILPLIPLGLILAIVFWIADPDSTVLRVFIVGYCYLNIIIATVFIEYIKREERFRASEWGTLSLKEDEFIRPLFRGFFRRSPIDDDLNDPHETFVKKYWRRILSWMFALVCLAGALGLYVLLFWARYELARKWEGDSKIILAVLITAAGGAVAIVINDIVFVPICFRLTKFENIKTKDKFENSYVLKLFFFRFMNAYGPLFYIAFAKKHVTGCITNENNFLSEDNECIWELRYQLIFLFLLYILDNVLELLVPFLKMRRASHIKFTKESVQGKSNESILKRKLFIEYSKSSINEGEVNGIVEEYFELIMQSGTVFLFSIAFGFIPLIVFLNNIWEMIVDRSKILNYSRRPIPQAAKSHGIFTNLLEIIAFCGIFTNLGITCFTMRAFGEDDKYTNFIWGCVTIFIIRFMIQELIPDEPERVYNIRQRHKVIIQRTLGSQNRLKDERFKGERTDFFIKNTENLAKDEISKEIEKEESSSI